MSADTEQHTEPMAAASRPQSRRPELRRPETRGSERGAATRAGLLDAARAAFTSGGYAEANVTDIVAAAGASVGSLYHHFSGKSDLFLTLFEEFHTRLTERTRTAVHQLRDQGGSDPKQLFLAGARAYLDGCIDERDLSALFMRGDGPPGFELIMRRRQREWAEKNAEFFARGTDPAGDAVAIVLTGALMLAVAEVSLGTDVTAARSLADRVIKVIARIDITGRS
jgi:AcrR family transcriptional regulator